MKPSTVKSHKRLSPGQESGRQQDQTGVVNRRYALPALVDRILLAAAGTAVNSDEDFGALFAAADACGDFARAFRSIGGGLGALAVGPDFARFSLLGAGHGERRRGCQENGCPQSRSGEKLFHSAPLFDEPYQNRPCEQMSVVAM